jgi:hypothetical protein
MSRFSLDLRRFSVARIENHIRGERGEIRFESRLAQVRTPDLPRRSEFMHLEISNFDMRSNLTCSKLFHNRSSFSLECSSKKTPAALSESG